MRDRFFALPGIESGEKSMVSLLLVQSILLGIFFGAFDISAYSLFLSVFDERMMAKGFVVSGTAGIIITSFYTWLQTRIQFRNFSVVNLISVALLTFFLWLVIVLSPAKWVIFIVFIMLGPLNLLAVSVLHGNVRRLFSQQQEKRIAGLVDSGLLIGIIIICYTIPVLLNFNFSLHNILFISTLSVLVAAFLQVLIRRFFTEEYVNIKTDHAKENGESIFAVFRNDAYTRIMVVFIALSVVIALFIQYSFMAVTRAQYPSAENMARFLGIFTGGMMVFTLLAKLLVFPYLIRNYGLRICLVISPFIIAILTVLAIIAGMFMGYSLESTGEFIIFFLFLALSRLFSKALKDSIESPSFRVIYETLSEKIKFRIQSGLDVTINEIALLSSGLMLVGLGSLSSIRQIHFSLFLLGIVAVWLFVALSLYKEYRKSIRFALKPENSEKTKAGSHVLPFKSRFSAEKTFKSHYFSLVSGEYSVLKKKQVDWYYKKIIDFSEKKSDVNLVPVLEKLSIDDTLDKEIRTRSADLAANLLKSAEGLKSSDKLASSRKSLLGTRLPQTTEILRLLRDSSIESRRTGIFLIGKFKLSDMLAEVFECLNIPGLENDALSVLQNFDGFAGPELERFYLVSSGNADTGRTILRLLGKSGTKENKAFLFSRLWSNSRQVKEIVARLLIECNFKPSADDTDKLHQLISDVVGIMAWNLSAEICLDKAGNRFVSDVMKKESGRWNDFLFNILSITYDAGSISKIRENLRIGSIESFNNALEMISMVIDETIRPKMTALLDIVPDEVKIKNLSRFYPGERQSYTKLLDDIINRDYNLVSVWTKAAVLRSIDELEGDDFTESVVALLFSPEEILQEESARLILRSSRELYKSVSTRLSDSTKKYLDMLTAADFSEKELLFEKVAFLSGFFKTISEEELLPLAKHIFFTGNYKDASGFISEGCISWRLNSDYQKSDPVIYYSEKSNGNEFVTGSEYYILPFNALEKHQWQYPEKSSEILKLIDTYEE